MRTPKNGDMRIMESYVEIFKDGKWMEEKNHEDVEIERLIAEVDEHQQQQDEIIVALGSQGILPSEIVEKVRSLYAENRNLRELGSMVWVNSTVNNPSRTDYRVPGEHLLALRDFIQQEPDQSEQKLIDPSPNRRYDEVYLNGVKDLDENG